MKYVLYIIWGATIGTVSGMVGIGGGIIIVPTLVLFFGLSQHQAQGTSIAMMIPPIGLAAAIKYYNEGNIIISIAALGALGFFFGGYFGASLAHCVGEATLKRIFGALLTLIGLRMLYG